MKINQSLLYFLLKKTFILGVLLVSWSVNADVSKDIGDFFKKRIATINQTLVTQQDTFSKEPESLADFVDLQLIPIWHSSKTLRGLFGKNNWLSLPENSKVALTQEFNNTLQRYVQEGFRHYDGQKLEFVEVKVNKKQTRGLLIVKVIPNVIPSFEVALKLLKEGDDWFLYDVLVKGVSYISIKKDGFRKNFKEQGFEVVLASIRDKNKGYIESKYSKLTTPTGNIKPAND